MNLQMLHKAWFWATMACVALMWFGFRPLARNKAASGPIAATSFEYSGERRALRKWQLSQGVSGYTEHWATWYGANLPFDWEQAKRVALAQPQVAGVPVRALAEFSPPPGRFGSAARMQMWRLGCDGLDYLVVIMLERSAVDGRRVFSVHRWSAEKRPPPAGGEIAAECG